MEGYIIYALLGWLIVSDLLNRHERIKLLNRVMAKNYQEFEYYDKKYEGDLKEVEALRDESRDGRVEEIQANEELEDKDNRKIMDAFDEDWANDEIDKTKIADIVK
jgi:hypothetical protein